MKITNREEVKEYIEYYYKHIGEGNLKKALINYSESKGFGIEDIWCCFANEYEEWEEDYFGDHRIAYYFDYPAVEKDCIVILTYEEFYKYLFKICEKYIKRHLEEKEIIYGYLDKIKTNLSVS